MSSLRQRVVADLAAAGLAPLHRLGQNFMVEESALDCLVRELGATPGVRVVEIGPGTGHLTERLLAAGCTVLAVELDKGLFGFLRSTFDVRRSTLAETGAEAGPEIAILDRDGIFLTGASPVHETSNVEPRTSNLTLVHGDCLLTKNRLHPAIEAFAAQPWRLGANLPYDVALPVLLNAVALPVPPQGMVVTVQAEAAQRLCSRPGDEAWGASAAILQAAGVVRLVRRLSPGCFHPQPRVDSAIIAWTPRAVLPSEFGRFCRAVFSARRKVLPGALHDAGHARETALAACRMCGLDPARRLENLDADELVALFRALGGHQEDRHA
jgi:16S rRNA (adenine1518-N6/adenine1519-N6)-dimethyltransferase